jgi:GTP cyclohydrolase I
MEDQIRKIIELIGENPEREGLLETPHRVSKAYEKIFSGYGIDPISELTVFENEGYDEMIIVKDIEFYSTCEHHMLPFFGKVHVGYLPDKKIVGLSKIPRFIEIFSRRMQNQERMTSQIAEAIDKMLKPKGVGVVVEAKHFCMMARGVEKQGSSVTTSAVVGRFKSDINTRSEFLNLIK